MLLTNTGWLGARNGLNGFKSRGTLAGIFDNWSADDIQKATTGVNSELLYLTNLQRINNGLPPINAANAAPSVNVGLDPQLKTALMVGGGLLLLVMLAKRKRG